MTLLSFLLGDRTLPNNVVTERLNMVVYLHTCPTFAG